MGTSLFNWLTSSVEYKGKTYLFSEFIKIKTGKEWYLKGKNDFFPSDLGFKDLPGEPKGSGSKRAYEFLKKKSNRAAAIALLEWTKINKMLLKNSLYESGIGKASKSKSVNWFETKGSNFFSNLYEILVPSVDHSKSLKLSKSFWWEIRYRTSNIPISYQILSDQATDHFEKLFKIWFKGNQVNGDLKGVENLWGIVLKSKIKNGELSIIDFRQIEQNWNNWYRVDSIGYTNWDNSENKNNLGGHGPKRYIIVYDKKSEYISADLHFFVPYSSDVVSNAGLISSYSLRSNLKKLYPFKMDFAGNKQTTEVAY
ncbi:MAG: hypothetical protein DRO88_13685 [Promethearchaeia archaeon]|nr:MAG: hypothetical protein DRO88_13685 [Candidatus Lokiarchaeia archaeon]